MLVFPDDLLPHAVGRGEEDFMLEALLEAKKAWLKDEVPIGAVMVKDGEILARAHNTREETKRPTDHAELKVIEMAAQVLGSWRLENTSLYVTLEPCCMCAGAIVQARVPKVVWGANDPKAGACTSLYEILQDPRLNHRCDIKGGVHGEVCGQLLKRYFKSKRSKN